MVSIAIKSAVNRGKMKVFVKSRKKVVKNLKKSLQFT